MARTANLKRKSFFVDERSLRQARRLLGVATDAEAVRLSLARTAEMERFWRFMDGSRKALSPGSMGRG